MSQAGRLGRLCLSIGCSALSFARLAQAERDMSHAFHACSRRSSIYKMLSRQ